MISISKAICLIAGAMLCAFGFAQSSLKQDPPFFPIVVRPDSPFKTSTFTNFKPEALPRIRFSYGQAVLEGAFGPVPTTIGQIPAFSASTSLKYNQFGVQAKYLRSNNDPNALADTMNIGAWWNPTDMQALLGVFNWQPTQSLLFTAGGSIYAPLSTQLDTGATATSSLFGIQYSPTKKVNVSVQYEELRRSPLSLGYAYAYAPNERWYTLGVGYKLNNQTSFKFFWQMSDVDLKNLGNVNPFNNNTAQRPGLISSQLSIKF